MVWGKVLYHDSRRCPLCSAHGEQRFDGFQPSGRGTDAYHRTRTFNGLACVILAGFHCLHRLVRFLFPSIEWGKIYFFTSGKQPQETIPRRLIASGS